VGRRADRQWISGGTLYALDLGTGRLRWQMSLGARSQTAYGFPTLGINGTPMLADERVYVAMAMTDVVCLDAATGGVMWRTRVGDPGKSETIWSAPLVWKNFVYVGIDGIYDEPTVGGRVVALEAATGRIVWQLGGAKQILGPPAVSKEGVVFAADYAGTVWGVDAQTGRPLWRGGTGGFAWKGGVSLAPGAVLVGAAAPGNALVTFGIHPSPQRGRAYVRRRSEQGVDVDRSHVLTVPGTEFTQCRRSAVARRFVICCALRRIHGGRHGGRSA
jgi:outer membrane protein assembly factor BamB